MELLPPPAAPNVSSLLAPSHALLNSRFLALGSTLSTCTCVFFLGCFTTQMVWVECQEAVVQHPRAHTGIHPEYIYLTAHTSIDLFSPLRWCGWSAWRWQHCGWHLQRVHYGRPGTTTHKNTPTSSSQQPKVGMSAAKSQKAGNRLQFHHQISFVVAKTHQAVQL